MEQFIPAIWYLVGFIAFAWLTQFLLRKLFNFNRRRELANANEGFKVEPLNDDHWIREHAKNFQSLRFNKIVNGFVTYQNGRRSCLFDYFFVQSDGDGSSREWRSACVIEINSRWTFRIIREGRLGKLMPTSLVRTNLSQNYSIYSEQPVEIPSTLRDNIQFLLSDEVIGEVDVQASALLVRPQTMFLAKGIPTTISEWYLLGTQLVGLQRDYVPPNQFWKLLEKGLGIAELITLESEAESG